MIGSIKSIIIVVLDVFFDYILVEKVIEKNWVKIYIKDIINKKKDNILKFS